MPNDANRKKQESSDPCFPYAHSVLNSDLKSDLTSDLHSDVFSAKTDSSFDSDDMLSSEVCSATECTGLIPALHDSAEELEAYEEMYHFLNKDASKAAADIPLQKQ